MRDRTLGETWGSYLRAAREHAGLTKPELAKTARVARATVYRWEDGESRPEQAEIVVRVARALGVNLDEALTAAGLRPGMEAPDRPTRQDPPMDEDIKYLLRRLADPDVRAEEKRFIRASLQRAVRIMQEQEELAAAEDELNQRRQAD